MYLKGDLIIQCNKDGSQKRVYIDFSTMSSPFEVVKNKDTLFFSEIGKAQMVSLKDKKVKTYTSENSLSDNVLVCLGNIWKHI